MQAFLQSLSVIIFTLNLRACSSAKASSHQGCLINIIEQYVLALTYVLLEVDGLIHGSWEAINKVVLGRSGDETVDQDLNCQFKRDETSIGHDLSDSLPVFGTLRFHNIKTFPKNEKGLTFSFSSRMRSPTEIWV